MTASCFPQASDSESERRGLSRRWFGYALTTWQGRRRLRHGRMSAALVVVSVWAALTGLGCQAPPSGEPTRVVLRKGQVVSLADHLETLSDAEGAYDYASLRDVEFVPPRRGFPRLERYAKTSWVRFVVDNQSEQSEWMLRLAQPNPVEMEVFIRTAGGHVERHLASYRLAAPQEIPWAFDFLIPMHLPLTEQTEVTLRLTDRVQAAIVEVMPASVAPIEHNHRVMLYGIYAGVLLALVLYNFVFFLVLRDPAYAYYVIHSAMTGFYFLMRDGVLLTVPVLGGFLPKVAQHGDAFASAAVLLMAGGMSGFVRHFLVTKDEFPKADLILRWVPLLPVLGLLLYFTPLSRATIPLAAFTMLATYVVVTAVGVRSVSRGSRLGAIFLVGWGAYLLGGMTYALRILGVAPYNMTTSLAPVYGSAVEFILLSLALGYRVRTIQEERSQAIRGLQSAKHAHELALQEEHRAGLVRLVEGQDQERQRIGRDVHDGIGHLFVQLLGWLRLQERLEEREVAERLIEDGIVATRVVSAGLHPSRLDHMGLTASLRALCDDVRVASGVEMTVQIDETTGLLSQNDELHLYRVTQEVINNAIRHGEPTQVEVALVIQEGNLHLSVWSDGQPVRSPRAGGLGLTNIKERCAIIGAQLALMLEHPDGPRVEVTLPLSAQRASSAPGS